MKDIIVKFIASILVFSLGCILSVYLTTHNLKIAAMLGILCIVCVCVYVIISIWDL